MKKIMIFAALAAALTLSSCSKEESRNDVTGELRTVNFTTSTSNTKTIFGDKVSNNYPILWQAGDKVCPSLNFSSPTEATDIPITPVGGGTGASFSGEFPDAATYQFFFVSPAAAFKTLSKADNYIGVEFPGGQTPTATSPDPVAQVLFANTGELTEIPNPVNLTFKHLSAYLHLNIINVNLGGATVQSVNITNEANPIAGRFRYYLDTETFTAYSPVNTIAVTTSSLTDIWCGLAPVDLSSGELIIVVSTDQGTFTKTVHMPASAKLTPGKIAKFTVDMDGVAIVSPVVYTAVTSTSQLNVGDKVIIAVADTNQAYALGSTQNTNNRAAAGVTKTADVLTNPTDAVEIFQLEDGIIPGHYAFRTTVGTGSADGYLYAANPEASGSNLLKTKGDVDNSASWDISLGTVSTWENAAIIFADIPSTGRGLIRFNSEDKLFSAYGAGSTQQAVKLYRLDGSVSPYLNVTLPQGDVVVSSATVQVPVYVFGNVDWTATVTGDAVFTSTSSASASGTGATILNLSLPAIASAEESYTLTVSTSEAVAKPSYAFTVKQIKSPAVDDILFHELYWTGSEKSQTLMQYLASGSASTVVYGGAKIVYSQDSKSKFYDWPANASVFVPQDYSGPLSTAGMENTFRIQANGGFMKAAGIPCKGVKSATLTYSLNRSGTVYTASSDTEGVTVGSQTKTSGTSDWGRTYNKYSYPLTFENGLDTFNFTITDSHASYHIYIADVKIVVTEVY